MVAFSILALLAAAVSASPIAERAVCPSADGDAPYSYPCSTYQSSIRCYTSLGSAPNGSVLLVHGTGSSPSESWDNGPYHAYLGKDAGVDVCTVALPDNSLGDAQVTAEYVAYSIGYLASGSKTQKTAIIGHSQGAGLNPQWALDYWPSMRSKTSVYVALAPDFRGVNSLGPSALPATPAAIQQTKGSNYLAAQNKRGGKALVSTTTVYSSQDEIVPNDSSPLDGAANFLLQQPDLCGNYSTLQGDHFVMVVNPTAYSLARDAIMHNGHAVASRIPQLQQHCLFLVDNILLTNPLAAPALTAGAAAAVARVAAGQPRVTKEPSLKPYVCAAGDAPASQCA